MNKFHLIPERVLHLRKMDRERELHRHRVKEELKVSILQMLLQVSSMFLLISSKPLVLPY